VLSIFNRLHGNAIDNIHRALRHKIDVGRESSELRSRTALGISDKETRDDTASHRAGLRRTARKGVGAIRSRPPQPRRAASIVATSIFFIGIIASNARLASTKRAFAAGRS
jgi:hypothetical protein